MSPRSRRRRSRGGGLIVFVLAAALAAGWIVADGKVPWASTTPSPAAGADPSLVPPRPTEAFALTVTYVFDGDTIEAHPHAPNELLGTTDPTRIRLIGIDTPEGTPAVECGADEARAHLRALLPEGSTVWAAPDVEWRDRYDRALLYLWTEDGRFVTHELVAAGHAEALLVEPNRAHHALMLEAEASARAEGRGNWGACG